MSNREISESLEEKRPTFWKNILIMLVCIVLFVIVTLSLNSTLNAVFTDTIGGAFVSQVTLLFISLFIVPICYKYFYGRWLPIGFQKVDLDASKTIGMGVFLIFSFFVLHEVLQVFLEFPPSDWIADIQAARGSKGMALMMFTAIIIAPIAEEILFRGLIMDAFYYPLSRRSPTLAASIVATTITAVLFSLLHWFQYNYVDLSYIFFCGMIFGWARWASKSMTVPVIIHMFAGILGLSYLYLF